MRRVLFGNNKGGSGKSGVTINVAAALAEAGYSVLVGDLDPQANASRRLGVPFNPANPTLTMSEVIKDASEGVAAEAVVPCGWGGIYSERIHVIPSRFDLENRISEAGIVGAAGRLRRAMAGVDSGTDFTLFDLPPSLGHLTQLGMACGDLAVVVVDPEFDGVEGAVRYRDFVVSHAADLGNPSLRFAGAIVSRVRPLASHAYQVEGLPELFGEAMIWQPHISERAQIKDAADGAVPLRSLGAAGRPIADAFAALAERLVKEASAA